MICAIGVHYFMAVFIQHVVARFHRSKYGCAGSRNFYMSSCFRLRYLMTNSSKGSPQKTRERILTPFSSVFIVFFLFENLPCSVEAQMSQDMRHVVRE